MDFYKQQRHVISRYGDPVLETVNKRKGVESVWLCPKRSRALETKNKLGLPL